MSTWPRFLCLYSHIESKAELATFLFVRRKERRGSEGFIYSLSLFSLEEERLCSVSLLTLFSRDHQQTLFLLWLHAPSHMQYPTKAWSPTSATSTSHFNLGIELNLSFFGFCIQSLKNILFQFKDHRWLYTFQII